MRFGGYVLMAFVTAFLVSHWASAGFPTWLRTTVSELKASDDVPTFGSEGAQKLAEEQAKERADRLRQPDDPITAPLRRDAEAAAVGYAKSPCSADVRATAMTAITAYAARFNDILQCPNMIFCPDKNREAFRLAIIDPRETSTRDAISRAHQVGGLNVDDFSPSIHPQVAFLLDTRGPIDSSCPVPPR
jgi:hypothetical protein